MAAVTQQYTGRVLHAEIQYVTAYEQKPGYVVFGFRLVDPQHQEPKPKTLFSQLDSALQIRRDLKAYDAAVQGGE